MRSLWLLFVLTGLFSGRLLAQSSSEEDNFFISAYKIDVTFTDDGEALFDEVIEVEFLRARRGIFRVIPIRSIIDGRRVDRVIKDITVDGFPFAKSRENNNLILRIGDPDVYLTGRQLYRIRYRVVNPIDFFDDHGQFYWDLIGVSWPVRIETFRFNLDFPDNFAPGDNEIYFYSGNAGATSHNVKFDVSPGQVRGNTTETLRPYEAVTVAVKLPHDLFPPPSEWEMLKAKYGYFMAAVLFVFCGGLARFLSRNKRQTIMTEYFPPEGISPAIAGGFVDHSVDNHDVLSLIPHLANKGYLRMEVTEKQGLFKKNEITFIRLKSPGDDLFPFEEQFFNALFVSGDRVVLSSLKDKFYTHLSLVKSSVKEWIKAQGWYESDQKTMGCVVGLMALGAIGWGGYVVFGRGELAGLALMGVGVLLVIMAAGFNKRSPKGNETYRQLEGFRQFVKKAEKPVIERLLKEDPHYYDKTMPFALAFGYLKQWNKQFDGLLSEPPSWYGGAYPMTHSQLSKSWSDFSTSFPSEINSVGSVFSSAPSSSGSGGSGGGGFSGGGSGGGGGGSW